jgi:ParB/RepB/Spo0J family partition protein
MEKTTPTTTTSATSSRVRQPNRKVQSTPNGILKKIHPRMVADSPWTSRHKSAFDSPAYLALRQDLEAHSGNQVPVLVRPNPSYKPGTADSPKWQLVYGGMRKVACLNLDIRLLVIVQDLTDEQAFQKAHAENSLRSQLSVFERGQFYCSALKSGLFGSMREQAAYLKVSVSEISRATFLAKLPNEVLQTMTSPADIQILDADKLRPAWDRDPFEVMMRADEINEKDGPLSAKEAILRLTRPEPQSVAGCNTSTSIPLKVGDVVFGQLNISATGQTSISFRRALSQSLVSSLQSSLIDFAKDHIEEL